MVFSAEATGCPATCVNPEAPEDCDLEPVEGCVCKNGYVLSDGKCVPLVQCGCYDQQESKYYPVVQIPYFREPRRIF